MRLFIFTLLSFLFFNISAQIKLGKSIGLKKCPGNYDTLQQSLHIKQNGTEPGPKAGNAVPNFKLYGLNNDSLDIALELKKGKSVFLINGSFSCPFFRHTLRFFDSIAFYHSEISFFIIYSIEAHPSFPFICPYTNKTTVLVANNRDSVQIKQPYYYFERKNAAKLMMSRTCTSIPVFLDGPANKWIHTFAEMPATAYLIGTDGKIKYKYLNYKSQRMEIIRDISPLK